MTRKPHPPRPAGRTPRRRRTRTERRSGSPGGPAAELAGIDIHNAQSHVRISVAYVRKVVRTVLGAERVTSAAISIALADNATVRRVNRDYLQHDYDTDVLSFLFDSMSAKDSGAQGRPADDDSRRTVRIDGEILASAEMAVETASQFGWSARDELTLYLVHGLLHLCGYDDQTLRERRIMRGRERAILAELGIVSPGGPHRSVRRMPGGNGSAS
jgi:probable rRNA maturation factor